MNCIELTMSIRCRQKNFSQNVTVVHPLNRRNICKSKPVLKIGNGKNLDTIAVTSVL